MTDPRLDPGLLRAVQRLPCGSGVIFRHYQLNAQQRRRLFRKVARICRRRGHMLLYAGNAADARRWHADGYHLSGHYARLAHCGSCKGGLLKSAPVHNSAQIAAARAGRADVMLLSPLHATQSHPGGRTLGLLRFRQLAALAGQAKLIALGGMTRPKAAMLGNRLVHGWAAIDAFQTIK